jgi:hypothetical protein
MTINPDITQKEKREVLRNDQRVHEQGSTYAEVHKVYADDLERGGRYSQPVDQTRPKSGGWSSLWTGMPPEPQLGYSVNDQETTGEPHEIAASKAPPSPETTESRDSVTTDVTSGVGVDPSKFFRRF